MSGSKAARLAAVVALLLSTSAAATLPGKAAAQPGTVVSHQKISVTQGGFTGTLDDIDRFGWSVAALGDLDGDGVGDLAVGAHGDDDGGPDRGAVWILFLDRTGKVKAQRKISSVEGGFTGALDDDDAFAFSVAGLGDSDGDGVVDLAVGARLDDGGGPDRGAVWLLFLNRDGTVKAHQKISSKRPWPGRLQWRDLLGRNLRPLDDGDEFGISVTALGDLDGDGVGDLAVGARLDDDGGNARGAVWIMFLKQDGRIKSHQKISSTEGGFAGELHDEDEFGFPVAGLGDVDGDGVADLAVGARRDDDGGSDRGAVWLLFLKPDGTVKAHQKISDTAGGFGGTLDDTDEFGVSITQTGDLDGDGITDVAVGARRDDDGGSNYGAVWLLFLDRTGTVKSHQKISATAGGFSGTLQPLDWFGSSLAWLRDLTATGTGSLAVGAEGDDGGGSLRGAVWVLHLRTAAPGAGNAQGASVTP